jgi:DNA-binding MltR family transcriptional regulator
MTENTTIQALTNALLETIAELPKTKINDHIIEITEFRIGLAAESDRASGLMSAAFLEDYLSRLIGSFMVDDKKVKHDIFSHNGPLGTFSSKIDMAFMLGLISNNTKRDLHLLRKIRNEFAHSAKPLEFTNSAINSRCGELSCAEHIPKTATPRTLFNRSMMVACQEMALTLINLKHIDEKQDKIVPNIGLQAFKGMLSDLKEGGVEIENIEKIINAYPLPQSL